MSIVRGYGPDACDDLTYKTSNHEFFGTPGDEPSEYTTGRGPRALEGSAVSSATC